MTWTGSTAPGAWPPAIESRGWTTTAETEGFRTVHSPAHFGDGARHAVDSTRKRWYPALPMDPAEAEAFIQRLMGDWLRSKGWSA